MITQFLSEAFTPSSTSCEYVSNPYQNFGDTDGAPSNLPSVDGRFNGTRTTCDIENVLLNSNMIVDQLLSTDQVYLSDELATGFSDHQALATSSRVQVYIYYYILLYFLSSLRKTVHDSGHSTNRFKQKKV